MKRQETYWEKTSDISVKGLISRFLKFLKLSNKWRGGQLIWTDTSKKIESESRSAVSDSLQDHGLYIIHGILQARTLGWVVFPFSRGSSQPRDQTQVSRIAGRFFTSWAMKYVCEEKTKAQK